MSWQCIALIIFAVVLTIVFVLLWQYLAFRHFLFVEKSSFDAYYRTSLVNYCSTLPPISYAAEVIVPADLSLYDYQLAQALMSISINTSNANCLNIFPIPAPPGLSNYKFFTSLNPLDGKPRMFAAAFWDETSKLACLSFSGTFFQDEWLNDLDFPQVPALRLHNTEKGVACHRGFYQTYISVQQEIWAWYNEFLPSQLFITGHSLGGALSILGAFDFATITPTPIHYSFAAPRVGNVAFAERFQQLLPNSFRVNNTEDVVPQVPLADTFGNIYQHPQNNVPFTVSLANLSDDHVTAYLDYLPNSPSC